MSVTTPAYLEIVDFIAGSNPAAIVNYHPSLEVEERLANLMEREKTDSLSIDEQAELNHFVELEHILRMAKAKARQILERAG